MIEVHLAIGSGGRGTGVRGKRQKLADRRHTKMKCAIVQVALDCSGYSLEFPSKN